MSAVGGFSQGVINHGANISITAGTKFRITVTSMNFINKSAGSNAGTVKLSGDMYIQGSWYNNASTPIDLSATNGTVHFIGSVAQEISGTNGSIFPNVIVDNDSGVIINNDITVNHDLLINTSKKLVVSSTKSLTVNGTLSNNSGITGLIIKSDASGTGSLIHHTAFVPATVERYILGGEWHQISSPISNAVSGMFLGKYLQDWENCNWVDIPPITTPLTPLQGFAIYNATSFTAQYQGFLNEGTIGTSNNLPAAPACNGIYVVGNPYASAIDWDANQGWIKTNLNNSVYIHKNATTWASYVGGAQSNGGSRYIASGQGFIVIGVDGNSPATINMSDMVRVNQNTTFFKDALDHLIRLEVTGGNNYVDETVIRFVPEATKGFDTDWDAFKILGDVAEAPQIYSLIPDQGITTNELSINTLPDTQDVPIGITIGASGNYTIRASEMNGLNGVRLEDKTTGVFTDLQSTSYTFSFSSGQVDTRFILHFSPLGDSGPKAEFANIYSVEKTVYVNMSANERGNIYIYNMTGQLIASSVVQPDLNRVNLSVSTGTYIVKVITNNHSIVKKVFLN